MSESRDHRRLVVRLVRGMERHGILVASADSPGWPPTPTVFGRRPDALGFYLVGGTIAAGEAKRGPELWRCRQQLADLMAGLPSLSPVGAGALLILAVEAGWEMEARAVIATLPRSRTATVVWGIEG